MNEIKPWLARRLRVQKRRMEVGDDTYGIHEECRMQRVRSSTFAYENSSLSRVETHGLVVCDRLSHTTHVLGLRFTSPSKSRRWIVDKVSTAIGNC